MGWFTEESSYKPSNHRAGKAGVSPPVPVVTRPSRNSFGARAPGAAVTRPSLRPLHSFEGCVDAKPGRKRRGNAKPRLALFETSFRMHTLPWHARLGRLDNIGPIAFGSRNRPGFALTACPAFISPHQIPFW